MTRSKSADRSVRAAIPGAHQAPEIVGACVVGIGEDGVLNHFSTTIVIKLEPEQIEADDA